MSATAGVDDAVGPPEPTMPTWVENPWLHRAASLILIVPAWVAAIRVGIDHVVPVGDTAIMALRAPDVISTHLPLIGMPASSASTLGHVVHFPGALQLYWLALPVTWLGPTWGTVVAMGLLNTIWILLGCRIIRRNVDPAQALVGLAVLSVFFWSIGSGMLIDSWPLNMVVVPFAILLIAAWGTACGDLEALVVLTVVTNYLLLDHLVVFVLAPLGAACGLVGLACWLRQANQEDPDGRGARTRRVRRRLVAVGVITLVMWLPSLIQQVFDSPGNLAMLLNSSGSRQGAVKSLPLALHVVAGLVGRPPFWFRGTLANPTFYRAPLTGQVAWGVSWFDLAVSFVVLGAFVGFAVLARRRGDRVLLWVLTTALVADVAAIVTVYVAPVTAAIVPEYFLSIWAVAMFTWFAIVLGIVRSVHLLRPGVLAGSACIVVVGFSVANLGTSHSGYTANPEDSKVSAALISSVVPKLEGKGRVNVTLTDPLGSNANYRSALLVAMHQAGIPYCFPPESTSLYTFIPTCDGSERTKVVLTEAAAGNRPAGKVLFEAPMFTKSTASVSGIERRLGTCLAGTTRLHLTPSARRPFLGTVLFDRLEAQLAQINLRDGSPQDLMRSPQFQTLVIVAYDHGVGRGGDLFEECAISTSELHRWATQQRAAHLRLWVTAGGPTG